MAATESSRPGVTRLLAIGAAVAAFGMIRLLFNLVGVRALSINAVGQANLALSWGMLLALPMSAGIAPMIARFAALQTHARRWSGLLQYGISFGAVWLFLTGVLGFAAMASQGAQVPRPSIALTFSWALGYSAATVVRAYVFAQASVRRSATLEAISVTAFLGALVVVSGSSSLAWVPFTAYFFPSVLILIALLVKKANSWPLREERAELRNYAGFALLGSVVSLGISSGVTLVAARGGLREVAVWATLSSLVGPVLLAPRTLSTAMLPRLSRAAAADRARFAEGTRVHRDLSSSAALCVIGPLVLLGPEIIQVTLRAAVSTTTIDVWWFLVVAAWGTLRGEPIVTATSALGQTRACAAGSAVAGVVAVVAWFSSRGFGLRGVAASYALFTLATPLLVSWFASRAGSLGPPGSRLTTTDALLVLVLLTGVPFFELPFWMRTVCAITVCGFAIASLLRSRESVNHIFAETATPLLRSG